MKTLDEIGKSCGTDKAGNGGHNYLRYYDMFFSPMRNKEITLMEIGVYNGDSIRMWDRYFNHARTLIVGIDIDDKRALSSGNMVVSIADQSNKTHLDALCSLYDFDIVVDDGSHQSAHQILSFEVLFKYLKSGGLYCIEDCLCGYSEQWVHNGEKSIIDRIKEMVGEVNMNGKIDLHNLCSDKEKNPDRDWTYFEKNIEWIFCSPGLVIIKKV